MSNGPVREAGETARSAINVFRDNPFTFALILMNLALLGFLYYSGVVAHQERREELSMLYDNRRFVGQLLAECQPAPRK